MEHCNVPSVTSDPVPLSLALWEPDDETRNRTVHMLVRLGFQVHGCRDAASLFQWMDLRDPDLILVGESAPVSQMVDAVLPRLSEQYAAGILVQAPEAPPQTRLNALHAGAHMCLDRRYEAHELAALLRAQARRAARVRRRAAGRAEESFDTAAVAARGAAPQSGRPGGRVAAPAAASGALGCPPAAGAVGLVGATDIGAGLGAGAAGGMAYALRSLSAPGVTPAPAAFNRTPAQREPWRIMYQGWLLVTPGGRRIHLTGTERACFACLLDSPKRELSRAAMRGFMTATNLRSVNVAISRLRKKVHDSGERLPLHTVHGMGYVFVGELTTED
ncbi:response regulator transcription factor [Bordetella genomosp. 9]|uniref:response regulator transcription factor n=1 Tax=Bordetella genomosp. 9 TaxID=1416803 RepID=UPI001E3DF0AD|nr:DNA-binding response regulator [Bordetella genomosp. 9]